MQIGMLAITNKIGVSSFPHILPKTAWRWVLITFSDSIYLPLNLPQYHPIGFLFILFQHFFCLFIFITDFVGLILNHTSSTLFEFHCLSLTINIYLFRFFSFCIYIYIYIYIYWHIGLIVRIRKSPRRLGVRSSVEPYQRLRNNVIWRLLD